MQSLLLIWNMTHSHHAIISALALRPEQAFCLEQAFGKGLQHSLCFVSPHRSSHRLHKLLQAEGAFALQRHSHGVVDWPVLQNVVRQRHSLLLFAVANFAEQHPAVV